MRTRRLVSAFFLLSVSTALACSGSSSSSGGPGGPSGTGSLTGTVGGKAFTFQSGLAYVDKQGAVDILVSDGAGLCSSVTSQKFHAGETLVQVYNLKGKVPGAFTSDGDVKYASVNGSCASGQSVEGSVSAKGRVTKSDFSITKMTATEVEGTLNITFDEGSTISGSFSLPICSTSEAEKATCY
jgi:hypothetical protein